MLTTEHFPQFSNNSGYAEAVVELEDDHDDEDALELAATPVTALAAAAVEVNQTAIVTAMHAAERKLPNPLLPVWFSTSFHPLSRNTYLIRPFFFAPRQHPVAICCIQPNNPPLLCPKPLPLTRRPPTPPLPTSRPLTPFTLGSAPGRTSGRCFSSL
jgi:hypothetical protein